MSKIKNPVVLIHKRENSDTYAVAITSGSQNYHDAVLMASMEPDMVGDDVDTWSRVGYYMAEEIVRLRQAQLALVVPDEVLRALAAVTKLNNEMYRWTSRMSYDGSYVGEPEGLLKRNIREIEHIMDACRAAMFQSSQTVSNNEELPEENGSSLQLRNLIRQRHAEWSDKTFGCVGPVGPLKHLSKEALEAAAEPDDLSEWADMQFLLWDAQRRAGISDAEITAAMEDKLKINMERQWPEPKDGEPRLHIKEPGNSPVTPDGWISCSERMPDEIGRYWCYVEGQSSLGKSHYQWNCSWNGERWWAGSDNGCVTHWMPLPEPPQEVKGE